VQSHVLKIFKHIGLARYGDTRERDLSDYHIQIDDARKHRRRGLDSHGN